MVDFWCVWGALGIPDIFFPNGAPEQVESFLETLVKSFSRVSPSPGRPSLDTLRIGLSTLESSEVPLPHRELGSDGTPPRAWLSSDGHEAS